jgi:plasmid stability protein
MRRIDDWTVDADFASLHNATNMVAKRQRREVAVGSITIRSIPRAVLRRLRARAEENHRSMQGEVMAILEAATIAPQAAKMTPSQVLAFVRSIGLKSPAEAVEMIREDRDAR